MVATISSPSKETTSITLAGALPRSKGTLSSTPSTTTGTTIQVMHSRSVRVHTSSLKAMSSRTSTRSLRILSTVWSLLRPARAPVLLALLTWDMRARLMALEVLALSVRVTRASSRISRGRMLLVPLRILLLFLLLLQMRDMGKSRTRFLGMGKGLRARE